jgi:pilus assembly protein CpaC
LKKVVAKLFGAWVVVSLWASVAVAQPQIVAQQNASQSESLEVGETRLLQLSKAITRVSVAEPTVADIRVVTPKQVLVTAKAVGFTHIIMWGDDDQPLVIAITARRNLNELRGQLKELFPQETIQVSAAGDLIVLSGKVSDLRLPSRMAEVAKLHTERLANLVEVEGNQQVQLEVRFAEVSRTGLRQLGVNSIWQDRGFGQTAQIVPPSAGPGNFLNLNPNPNIPLTGGEIPIPAPEFGGAFNLLYGGIFGRYAFSAILSVLSTEGLAKVLAEPTLVALSGQEAQFHAGGEVPIILAGNLGSLSVEFKKFGVRLKFTPTVLGDRTLNLNVFAEVSELDPSSGVVLGGFQIPGFKVRNGETTVRLRDGQSFAMAGLLSDSIRSSVDKIPLLGDIPILGALFRSTAFQREETELLVVVSAHLVQPLSPDQVPPLPGEEDINDPDDLRLFLLGHIDGWKKEKKKEDESNTTSGQTSLPAKESAPIAGIAGPVGFIR